MAPKKRSSNFELLRIISILLILLGHIAFHTDEANLSLFNAHLLKSFMSVGNIAVSCFILISGYFGVTLKWEQFLRLIIMTTLYSVLLFFVYHGFSSINVVEFARSVFVVPLYHNWFMSCYLILMLLSPFINQYCDICDKKTFTKLIITLFIAFCVIPTIFNSSYYTILTMGGKCLTYFIFIYLTGRYIRLHHDVIFNRKRLIGVYLITTLTGIFLNYTVSAIFNKTMSPMFFSDCSVFTYIAAISIFYLFKSFTFQSKAINFLSSSVLAVFLLDELRYLVDDWLVHLPEYANSYLFVVNWLWLAVCMFIICTAIDKLRILLFSKIETCIIQFIIKTCRSVGAQVNNMVRRYY